MERSNWKGKKQNNLSDSRECVPRGLQGLYHEPSAAEVLPFQGWLGAGLASPLSPVAVLPVLPKAIAGHTVLTSLRVPRALAERSWRPRVLRAEPSGTSATHALASPVGTFSCRILVLPFLCLRPWKLLLSHQESIRPHRFSSDKSTSCSLKSFCFLRIICYAPSSSLKSWAACGPVGVLSLRSPPPFSLQLLLSSAEPLHGENNCCGQTHCLAWCRAHNKAAFIFFQWD